ncbi:hypothetical protein BJV78DRAFT_1356525 [Lactifluus subvellereus]|nr:hypothetical protein BJV78DRAFT_1356525 [Lactifluus subvellereus]
MPSAHGIPARPALTHPDLLPEGRWAGVTGGKGTGQGSRHPRGYPANYYCDACTLRRSEVWRRRDGRAENEGEKGSVDVEEALDDNERRKEEASEREVVLYKQTQTCGGREESVRGEKPGEVVSWIRNMKCEIWDLEFGYDDFFMGYQSRKACED